MEEARSEILEEFWRNFQEITEEFLIDFLEEYLRKFLEETLTDFQEESLHDKLGLASH